MASRGIIAQLDATAGPGVSALEPDPGTDLAAPRSGWEIHTRSNTMSPQDGDPRPVPPIRPGSEDCCQGSCDPCIFDVYDDALDRYRADLQAWEARQVRRQDAP